MMIMLSRIVECETEEPHGRVDCSVEADSEASDFELNDVTGLWFVLGYTRVMDITWDAGVTYNSVTDDGHLDMTYTGYEK